MMTTRDFGGSPSIEVAFPPAARNLPPAALMARLLQAAGHRIELVALIDVPLVNAGTGMWLVRRGLAGVLRLAIGDAARRERLTATGMELAWRVWRAKLVAMLSRVRRFWQMDQATRRTKLVAMLSRVPSPPDPGLEAQYLSLLASYVPEPLDVPIAYYAAEHSGRHLKRISAQGEVVRIPTDHHGCITTHIHLVVDHLRKRLASRVE
jgi:oxalate---CoA ligase